MSDDLVKRARAQMAIGAEHLARTGGEVTQRGFMPLLCDRIEKLEERLKAATDDAKEAEAYAEELEARIKRAEEAIIDLSYWFETDQEILDAMSPDERADHERQTSKIKRALAALIGDET